MTAIGRTVLLFAATSFPAHATKPPEAVPADSSRESRQAVPDALWESAFDGTTAGGRFSCCGCNFFGGCDCCGGVCICEPDCPGTFCNAACNPGNALCNPVCGGSPCNVGCNPGPCGVGCPDECSTILCPGNLCTRSQCRPECNILCGGDACAPTCPDECSPIVCPTEALCNTRCPGGHPCNFGCICEPDCPTTRCSPLCGGGDACDVGCADECSPVLCLVNYCTPLRCDTVPECDLFCGGNPCGPGCPDECSPIVRPRNFVCEITCGGDPCNVGCICEPLCPGTLSNPLCGGGQPCDEGLPLGAAASIIPWTPNGGGSDVPSVDPALAVKQSDPVNHGGVAGNGNRIWGFADLHNHQFAHLGFGGLLLAGKPFEPTLSPAAGIGSALHCCGDNPLIPCGSIECTSNPHNNHGGCGCGDLIGAALGEFACHHVGGYPEFEGWPRWYTFTHQQVYFEWLHRAWQGGLRLMSMLAVNNELLCSLVNGIYTCEDMPAVDRQIQAAKALEDYIDLWDDGDGENNSGWYRIAYSAAQARQIMQEGKLAVVLGIEVAGLFGCREPNAALCTPEYIDTQLQQYYDMGVRQITPVHNIDNAFGGTAIYNEFFNAANELVNGQYFTVRDCAAEGYEFRLSGSPLLALVSGYLPPAYPPEPAAHCNAKGLTVAGRKVLEGMMARGMIIDVDHMSARTKDGALSLAENRCYPLISSHCGFNAISEGQKNHEGQESPTQLDRLRALGGLLAPITHQGDACGTPGDHGEGCVNQYGSAVSNNCSNSSRTWAQAFLYAVDQAAEGAVAMGTDFNGLAGQPSPRYGPEACNRAVLSQDAADVVQYPFAPHGLPGSLGPNVTGERTFNINCDGLAHVGLLPDFVQDLKNVGVDSTHLEPLFRSAEAYVSLWERAERQSDAGTDSRDVQPFVSCLEGPGQVHANCSCRFYDADGDLDVDLRDAAQLLREFKAP